MKVYVIHGVCIVYILTAVFSAGADVVIPPERLMQVEMSSTDVNRIVCMHGDVKDIVYSKEKGLSVKVVGSSAFIKFPVFKKGEELIYSDKPSEIYISCGSAIYSFIAIPEKVPSVTVHLQDRSGRIKKNVSLFRGLAFEDRILKLVRYAYTEEYPDAFVVEDLREGPDVEFEGLTLEPRKKVRVDGEGFVLYEYVIVSDYDREVREVDFMVLAKRPVAIGLESTLLRRGERYRLFVIDMPLLEDDGRRW